MHGFILLRNRNNNIVNKLYSFEFLNGFLIPYLLCNASSKMQVCFYVIKNLRMKFMIIDIY